jgi:hypothetical protein
MIRLYQIDGSRYNNIPTSQVDFPDFTPCEYCKIRRKFGFQDVLLRAFLIQIK